MSIYCITWTVLVEQTCTVWFSKVKWGTEKQSSIYATLTGDHQVHFLLNSVSKICISCFTLPIQQQGIIVNPILWSCKWTFKWITSTVMLLMWRCSPFPLIFMSKQHWRRCASLWKSPAAGSSLTTTDSQQTRLPFHSSLHVVILSPFFCHTLHYSDRHKQKLSTTYNQVNVV